MNHLIHSHHHDHDYDHDRDHGHSQSMADQIAQISHSLYDSLPNKAKPLIRNNGIPEWTILASIILSVTTNVDDDGGGGGRGDASIKTSSNIETGTGQMTLTTTTTATTYIPISLGTGVKCLPANRLPPLGDALHDSHAEILARRGFVRWLLTEAGTVIDGEDDGLGVLRFDHQDGMFRLREDVGVWLYVSALPVGLVSTLLHSPSPSAFKSMVASSCNHSINLSINQSIIQSYH